MKVITEAILRDELRCNEPETYFIPEGKILSPAAREYLQQRKIAIKKAGEENSTAVKVPFSGQSTAAQSSAASTLASESNAQNAAKYVDEETGAFYTEKPEHMTQLYSNVLVAKNHPRIVFRGKLDSLQAIFIVTQAQMNTRGTSEKLIEDLDNIVQILRELMRCDVLNEQFTNDKIIGLTHEQLRERSHNPMKFFKVKQMVLPDYKLGLDYAELNRLRTSIRETEVFASEAFRTNRKCTRPDIIEELNRLSSAVHIIMCKYLAGDYA